MEEPQAPWLRMGGKVWRCAGCGQALGVVLQSSLIVGVGLAIEETVRVRCLACGRHQRWHAARRLPEEQPAASAIKTL